MQIQWYSINLRKRQCQYIIIIKFPRNLRSNLCVIYLCMRINKLKRQGFFSREIHTSVLLACEWIIRRVRVSRPRDRSQDSGSLDPSVLSNGGCDNKGRAPSLDKDTAVRLISRRCAPSRYNWNEWSGGSAFMKPAERHFARKHRPRPAWIAFIMIYKWITSNKDVDYTSGKIKRVMRAIR